MNKHEHDLARVAKLTFDVTLAQSQAWMKLAHALQADPNVSLETKKAASEAFEKVDDMIKALAELAEMMPSLGGVGSDE